MDPGYSVVAEKIPLLTSNFFENPVDNIRQKRPYYFSNYPFFSGNKRLSKRSPSGDSAYVSAPSSPASLHSTFSSPTLIGSSASRNSTESQATLLYTPIPLTPLRTILDGAVICQSPRQSICEDYSHTAPLPLYTSSEVKKATSTIQFEGYDLNNLFLSTNEPIELTFNPQKPISNHYESLKIILDLKNKKIPEESILIISKKNDIHWGKQGEIAIPQKQETCEQLLKIFKIECNKHKNEFFQFIKKSTNIKFDDNLSEEISEEYEIIINEFKEYIKNSKLTKKEIFEAAKIFDNKLNSGKCKYNCIKRRLHIAEDDKVSDYQILKFGDIGGDNKKPRWVKPERAGNKIDTFASLIEFLKKEFVIPNSYVTILLTIMKESDLSKKSISENIDKFIKLTFSENPKRTATPRLGRKNFWMEEKNFLTKLKSGFFDIKEKITKFSLHSLIER